MLLVRRLLTIPAGIALLLFLVVALVVVQVSGTFLDPDFFPRELRKANLYEFVVVDLLTSAVDEARELSPEEFSDSFDSNPLVASELSTEDIVSSVNRAVPPEWIQAQVEEAFDQIGRYLNGERDEFTLTIQAGERVPTVVAEIKGLLRKADAYGLLFDEVITPAIDDALANELPLDVDISSQRIADAVRAVAPREWVQAQVESALDELTPYVVGERDTFELRVELADRVEVALAEVRALLGEADAYELLFDEIVAPKIDDALAQELPLDIDVSSTRLTSAVRAVATREWVDAQVDVILEQATPYLVGTEDSFEIRVELADRVEIALAEIKDILRETDAYALLYDQVVEPAVLDSLAGDIQLPFGISVTEVEVVSALREVAPVDWVQEQAEALIDSIGPYLTGAEDQFFVDISLVDNKRDASEVIEALVIQRLEEASARLPDCTSSQLLDLAAGDLGVFSRCVPGGIDLAQTIQVLDLDIAGEIDRRILSSVPNTIRFTDQNLRQTLEAAGASENVELVDTVREVVRDGWTYTSSELRSDLIATDKQAIADGIDDVRDILANGWTYDETDLRQQIVDLGVDSTDVLKALDDTRAFLADGWTYTDTDLREDLGSGVDDLDRGRRILKQIRTFRWIVYLPLIVLLLGIGFLGGTTWWSRTAWAGGALAICAVLIMITFGPVYGAVVGSRLDDAREEALSNIDAGSDFFDTQTLAVNKALDMGVSVADGLAGGVFGLAIMLLVLGLVMAIAPTAWFYYSKRKRDDTQWA